jgi:hypothetical protein
VDTRRRYSVIHTTTADGRINDCVTLRNLPVIAGIIIRRKTH